MGKRRRKGEAGAATSYISRNQSLKKLQLSLPDFRRLCILKGIYPHEPKNLKKVNKGSTAYKTFYYAKDIQFLAHEPLLEKFRDFKAFMRKVKRALGKQQDHTVQRLYENRPVYTLDHLVKERYPTFLDAIRDLDDALSMLFVFATLPQHKRLQAHVAANCKRLTVELMHYIIESRGLRKVFLSIKGIYYQADIRGEMVTWITPYRFSQQMPTDVDFRVMLTFVEFYSTLMGFVNYKLFSSLNLKYPPQIEGLPPPPGAEEIPLQVPEAESTFNQEAEDFTEILSSLSQSIARVVTDEGEEEEDDIPLDLTPEEEELRAKAREEERKLELFKHLFDGCRFFLSREVPRESLAFVVRSLGGEVSWAVDTAAGGSYSEPDDSITHQVVDRMAQGHRFLSRAYVQPQWVYDCVNQRRLLPTGDYAPGATLPPHLSPFVEEGQGDYVPPERAREMGEEEEEEVTVDTAQPGEVPAVEDNEMETSLVGVVREGGDGGEGGEVEMTSRQQREEKRLAIMMMSKKRRRLYEQIMKSRRRKAKEVSELKRRRQEYDQGIRVKKLRLEDDSQTIE